MAVADVLIAIAQVAAGGTIVQGALAFFRRRAELRQLDRQTDSVAVETADRVMVMMRKELEDAKAASAKAAEENAAEQADLRRQITLLGDEVSRLRAELVVARAQIARLQAGQPPAAAPG
ncbi:hypothetical protein [Microbispora sp. NPDC049125]|uniref:hypothetical protein n=1 Tax=Microbispora sp. NPDC049125 TaxID=3154929 RepID=UPI0034678306